MDAKIIIPLLALAACEGTVEDARSVAYEGRSELTVSDEPDENVKPSTLDGRYGASAADCETGNRYMTEYVELAEGSFDYRGNSTAIAIVRDDEIQLRGGERLAREGDTLVRWPDDKRKRTVYTRCS